MDQKLIGVAADPGCTILQPGADIYHAGRPVARVIAAMQSEVLGQAIGLALFPTALAFSGLTFALGTAQGPAVRSISMPPIMPRSLTVKLDEQ